MTQATVQSTHQHHCDRCKEITALNALHTTRMFDGAYQALLCTRCCNAFTRYAMDQPIWIELLILNSQEQSNEVKDHNTEWWRDRTIVRLKTRRKLSKAAQDWVSAGRYALGVESASHPTINVAQPPNDSTND